MRPSNFLTTRQRLALERIVHRPRGDHGVARRANAIFLLDDGESYAQIARFLYLDDDTIRGWFRRFEAGGWEALERFDWQGGQSQLTPAQQTALSDWLEMRLCRNTSEIRVHIAAEFGVDYSHSGSLKLLHRLGFEYRKPKALPQVADEGAQRDFIAFHEGLLNNLPADATVCFAGAVHPEYPARPAFGWVKKGSETAVKTTSGRARVNIHGAICLENFAAPLVEPVTVDGDSAVQLLAKIEANNPAKSISHVILDNAPHHKCESVKQWLSRDDCRIQLPTYCPHLNPIKRLWAVMHAHVTHNRFYTTQKQCAEAILKLFRETIPKQWRAFRDKITDNFRSISHQNFRVLA